MLNYHGSFRFSNSSWILITQEEVLYIHFAHHEISIKGEKKRKHLFCSNAAPFKEGIPLQVI